MLYIEAWGDVVERVSEAIQLGKVYCFAGARERLCYAELCTGGVRESECQAVRACSSGSMGLGGRAVYLGKEAGALGNTPA